MTAYYNEFDPYAAQWLRNLIAAGHIAPGDVDERSIEDVRPDDLRGYAQCHFFAGIGVWSRALRNVGFPDDARIWSGSCPCQPFSAAGKGMGLADERHLWPAFYHLILACEPQRIVGEQVASKDGLAWLDIVQADMEAAGHAFGAVDFCAAGVGAPHIRQRLYWFGGVADTDDARQYPHVWVGQDNPAENIRSSAISGLVHQMAGRDQSQPSGVAGPVRNEFGWLGDDDDARLEGQRRGYQAEGGRIGEVRPIAPSGEFGRMADAVSDGRRTGRHGHNGGDDWHQLDASCGHDRPGPTNGQWRDADWLFCRDGKWRPVEPGTFPLAHGAASRVGRLRAYGNAINLTQAEVFLASALT